MFYISFSPHISQTGPLHALFKPDSLSFLTNVNIAMYM